jgi:CheY-like chemotaxis protein
MDRGTFSTLIERALEGLYDRTHLSGSPLRQHFAGGTQPITPERLHRVLVKGIDALRPVPGSPTSSDCWRRYQYLNLRYVNGLSHKVTARELGLSLRQAHRVRVDAVNTLAGMLREGHETCETPPHPHDDRGKTLADLTCISGPSPATLDEELAHLDTDGHERPTDVAREVRAVADVVRPLADQHGASVSVHVAENIATVAVGRAVLRQVLVLLMMCALDYPTGRRLIVEATLFGRKVVIDTIAIGSGDVAGGISHRDARLTAARRLIEAEGGSLEILTLEGNSCLRITLPPPKTGTILTIDDNPDLARLFDVYLQGTDYEVIRAKTAQSALRLAANHHPDVVTLDVMMPFQDGWEIFRQLREDPRTRTIPIIVCSILPERELALALGAAGFLAKPVTRQSLLEALDQCLCS